MVKDLTTKRCLSDNERYADLINGTVFGVNFAVISLEVLAEYANSEGLIEMKKYHGKEGNVNMCKALEDLMTESRAEGREEGLAKGIVALIKAYQEFQVPKEEIIAKLEVDFDLPRESAEDYVRKYWK